MRSPLNALITEKALSFISTRRNSDLFELIACDQIDHAFPLKNVCAKVMPELSDEIDEICGLLGISKRRFLEAAMVEALSKAKGIIAREGVWEAIEDGPGVSATAVEEAA